MVKTQARRGAPAGRNPFLPAAPETVVDPTEAERDPLLGDEIAVTGPPQPLGILADPADIARLPARRVTETPALWVVGLHGGAGATTVASLLGEGTQEAGRCWPLPPDSEPGEAAGQPAPVLLVARTHAAGLDAAASAARVWASGHLGDLPLVGLVLVDDAPKLPKSLAAGCARVSGMTPRCWHLAWRESWREQVVPTPGTLPFRVRRTVKDIRTRASQARGVNQKGTP